jgi:RNA polymerase sigma-70 factor, ECF subfamily
VLETLNSEPSLENYHLLSSVRADFLWKLGRLDEARREFERAASITRNARERDLLLQRARTCGGGLTSTDDRNSLSESSA